MHLSNKLAYQFLNRHSGEVHRMVYGGFERDRATREYRCPARNSGTQRPHRLCA